ncbi:MAG: aspartate/glutamate racemase family protein [Archaeoglobaceae archaeon]
MKTIGLLGGMSWESSLEYYRIINELVSQKLGKLHSAKCILYSFDFEEIVEMQSAEDWEQTGYHLSRAAQKLERAGADMVLICTNTMHKVADRMAGSINVPLVNIVDVTAEEINSRRISEVGLLGTRFTMEDGFYTRRLEEKGISTLVPDEDEKGVVHNIIFEELCRGIRTEGSKQKLLEIISGLESRGAKGIILGCTELPLLVKPGDIESELFDTTILHATRAVELSLE